MKDNKRILTYISSRLNHSGHLTLLRALRNELGQEWRIVILETPQADIPNQHERDNYDDFEIIKQENADTPLGFRLIDLNPEVVYIQDEFFLQNCMEVLHAKHSTEQKWKVVSCLCENILDKYIRPEYEYLYKELDLLLSYAEFSYKKAIEAGFPKSVPVLNRIIPHPNVYSSIRRESTSYLKIGFLGRLVEEKGVKTLVDAFKWLGFPAKLYLVGEGELHGYGLPDERIVYKGINKSNQEKADFLKSMDVIVCPSISTPTWIEQAILVANEAMRLGTPVIGSNSGGIPEMIQKEYVFEEGNFKALVDTLNSFAKDWTFPQVRNYLSNEVNKIYHQERSAETCAKKIRNYLLHEERYTFESINRMLM